MLKNFLTVILLFGATTGYTQKKEMKVIYYDINWKKASKKDSVTYYRESFAEHDTLYVTDYHINGNKQMTGQYSDLKGETRSGYFTYYNDKGGKSSEGFFRNNKREGKWITWYETSERASDGNYVNDIREGEWTYYFKTGKPSGIWTYEKDTIARGNQYHPDGRVYNENDTFGITENPPKFRGILNQYLVNEIRYPREARENNIEGRVILQFIISKEGKIGQISILESADPYLDEEALWVVRRMPDWIPGTHNGQLVNVKVTLPVRFRLR